MTGEALPRTVRIAAVALVVYGVMVVISAALMQQAAGWEEARQFPRALIRCAGMAMVAWGLIQRKNWAWWIGTLLSGMFFFLGLAAMAILYIRAETFVPAMILLSLPLGTCFALLLMPSSRAAFGNRPVDRFCN